MKYNIFKDINTNQHVYITNSEHFETNEILKIPIKGDEPIKLQFLFSIVGFDLAASENIVSLRVYRQRYKQGKYPYDQIEHVTLEQAIERDYVGWCKDTHAPEPTTEDIANFINFFMSHWLNYIFMDITQFTTNENRRKHFGSRRNKKR